MLPSPRLLVRTALMALLALAVLFVSGCAVPVADAQQQPPYPPTTGATTAPTTGATTAPTTGATTAPTTGATTAPTTGATAVPTAVRPAPTAVRPAPLPNTSGSSLPILLGIFMLTLAAVIALARRGFRA